MSTLASARIDFRLAALERLLGARRDADRKEPVDMPSPLPPRRGSSKSW
jgi:hypothetical protein